MPGNLILFTVVLSLSAICFAAAVCVLVYYKRKDFHFKGDTDSLDLARKFTKLSIGITLSVLITLIVTLLSPLLGLFAFSFIGIILFLVACGISMVIGPAVSLLSIVFASVGETKKISYIVVSSLSMLTSFAILFAYVYIIV